MEAKKPATISAEEVVKEKRLCALKKFSEAFELKLPSFARYLSSFGATDSKLLLIRPNSGRAVMVAAVFCTEV